MQPSPFEMVEMARIVSGKRGWVTRGLMEYVGKGDRSFVCWGDRIEKTVQSLFISVLGKPQKLTHDEKNRH